MSEINFNCHSCGREVTFESEGATQLLLDDNTPRPVTYIIKCPHCSFENSVTKNNE